MKFQLIAVEYTGLKVTKGVFNPKLEALEEGGWTPKLIFTDVVKQHSRVENSTPSMLGDSGVLNTPLKIVLLSLFANYESTL